MSEEAQAAASGLPKPKRNDGGSPCGECYLKPGETCDICGAVAEGQSQQDWKARAEAAEARVKAAEDRINTAIIDQRSATARCYELQERAETAESRAHELSIKYVCTLRRAREMGEALKDTVFCSEALLAQLRSWGHDPSCNAEGIIDRARAALASQPDTKELEVKADERRRLQDWIRKMDAARNAEGE